MKTIRLLESQAQRLFELTTIGDDAPNNVQEYPGSTVSATANIQDTEGNPTFGHQPTADEVQRMETNPGLNRGRYYW